MDVYLSADPRGEPLELSSGGGVVLPHRSSFHTDDPDQFCWTATHAEVHSRRDGRHGVRGSISDDGSWYWRADGAIIQANSTRDGSRKAAWNFGWTGRHEGPEAVIRCSAEVDYDGVPLLAVAIDRGGGGTAIHVVDPSTSRMQASFALSYLASQLCPVYDGGDVQLAVGTMEGRLLLVDLDLKGRSAVDWSGGTRSTPVISYKSGVDRDEQRADALARGHFLHREFGGARHGWQGQIGPFPDCSGAPQTYAGDNRCISALSYFPETGTLAAGYRFGGWDLWAISSDGAEPVLHQPAPAALPEGLEVKQMAYQVPADDDWMCLWIGYGEPEYELQDDGEAAMVVLFQLKYSEHDLGHPFDAIDHCNVKWVHCLGAAARAGSGGLPPTQIQSIRVVDSHGRSARQRAADAASVRAGLVEESEPVPTYVVLTWSANAPEMQARPMFYVGIFDLEKWNNERYPPELSNDCRNAYFSTYALGPASDGTLVLDCRADPCSLQAWKSPYSHEGDVDFNDMKQRNTMSFDARVLSVDRGVAELRFVSAQHKVLGRIADGGILNITSRTALAQALDDAELAPRDLAESTNDAGGNEMLWLLLDTAMVFGQEESIVKEFARGAQVEGADVLQYYHWFRSILLRLTNRKRRLANSLFNAGLGKSAASMLRGQLSLFKRLSDVYLAFISLPALQNGANVGHKNLEHTWTLIGKELAHAHILDWVFTSSGVEEALRENVCRYDAACGRLGFEYNEVRRKYADRGHGVVLADKLAAVAQCPEIVVYPPRSLKELVSLFNTRTVDSSHRDLLHRLMYLFIHESRPEAASQFAQQFGVSAETQQTLRLFSQIDRDLLDRNSPGFSIGTAAVEGQDGLILRALSDHSFFRQALFFIRTKQPALPSREDVMLCIGVFMANRATADALAYIRRAEDPDTRAEALQVYFRAGEEARKMHEVLQLPLDHEEENRLEEYLLGSPLSPQSQDALVFFYLQRGRYVEAIRTHRRFAEAKPPGLTAAEMDRLRCRGRLLDGYKRLLPQTQLMLAESPNLHDLRPVVAVSSHEPNSSGYSATERPSVRLIRNIRNAVMLNSADDVADDEVEYERSGDINAAELRESRLAFLGPPATPVRHKSKSNAVVFPITDVATATEWPLSPYSDQGSPVIDSPEHTMSPSPAPPVPILPAPNSILRSIGTPRRSHAKLRFNTMDSDNEGGGTPVKFDSENTLATDRAPRSSLRFVESVDTDDDGSSRQQLLGRQTLRFGDSPENIVPSITAVATSEGIPGVDVSTDSTQRVETGNQAPEVVISDVVTPEFAASGGVAHEQASAPETQSLTSVQATTTDLLSAAPPPLRHRHRLTQPPHTRSPLAVAETATSSQSDDSPIGVEPPPAMSEVNPNARTPRSSTRKAAATKTPIRSALRSSARTRATAAAIAEVVSTSTQSPAMTKAVQRITRASAVAAADETESPVRPKKLTLTPNKASPMGSPFVKVAEPVPSPAPVAVPVAEISSSRSRRKLTAAAAATGGSQGGALPLDVTPKMMRSSSAKRTAAVPASAMSEASPTQRPRRGRFKPQQPTREVSMTDHSLRSPEERHAPERLLAEDPRPQLSSGRSTSTRLSKQQPTREVSMTDHSLRSPEKRHAPERLLAEDPRPQLSSGRRTSTRLSKQQPTREVSMTDHSLRSPEERHAPERLLAEDPRPQLSSGRSTSTRSSARKRQASAPTEPLVATPISVAPPSASRSSSRSRKAPVRLLEEPPKPQWSTRSPSPKRKTVAKATDHSARTLSPSPHPVSDPADGLVSGPTTPLLDPQSRSGALRVTAKVAATAKPQTLRVRTPAAAKTRARGRRGTTTTGKVVDTEPAHGMGLRRSGRRK